MENIYESAEWNSLSAMHPGGIYLTKKLLDMGEKQGINGKRVLDFGCGRGNSISYLSQRNYQVVGVDSSWNLIAKAKERYPDFDFHHYNKTVLPVEDNHFDFILCECTLSILLKENKIDMVMCEWRRVLKKEGILLISDLCSIKEHECFFNETEWKHLFEKQNFEVLEWKDATSELRAFIAEWIWKNEKPFPWDEVICHSMESLNYYIAVLKSGGD